MTTAVMDPAEAAVRMLIAQQAGRSIEQAGVPITPQSRRVWGELLASVASLPDAAVIDVPAGLLSWHQDSSPSPVMITKVGPHGYIHGWIKVGEDDEKEVYHAPVSDVRNLTNSMVYANIENTESIGRLADKIRTDGFDARKAPVILTGRDGSLDVKDGYHRIAAASLAGQDVIPVNVYRNTEAGRRGAFNQMMADDDASDRHLSKQMHVRADGIVAAGLAVRAKSTGRVLMIQRAADPSVCPCGMPLAWGLDDGDWWSHSDGSVSHDKSYGGKSVSDLVGTSAPDSAAGKWEFPGGRLDPGEEPLDAARREWSEETGLDVPPGEPVGAWNSGNYIGYVISVPDEESVPILDRSKGANPDDPDNEEPEAIAWWDPRELKDNPVVREELRDKPKRVRRALDAVSIEKQLSTGPFLVKVGPEGFVHGWRFVGVPSGAPVAESTGKNAYDAIRSADDLDLTQAQRDVVKDYTGMDFNNLNAYLRHGTQWPGAAQRIAMMNDVFDKSDPTKEPLMVRRFIESNAANDLFGPIGSRTGKSYTDKGYSSTTAHPGHFWDSADTVLHIHVPEGTKVIKPGPQTCHDVREQEIILPAGLKGTVISDEIVNGARTIHVAARW